MALDMKGDGKSEFPLTRGALSDNVRTPKATTEKHTAPSIIGKWVQHCD